MILSSRRSFISSFIALVAAPAIVRVSSIMPVKAILPIGPVEEFIGIIEDEVMIDGNLQFGEWKLFGYPTNRNFNTFDWDYPDERGEWKTYQGSWEAARLNGVEGTKYRVERTASFAGSMKIPFKALRAVDDYSSSITLKE
jgi:hypothetical protein